MAREQYLFSDVYRDRRVLVTGHTGFKGAWLAHWLIRLGAKVGGYSLPPPTDPSLFGALGWKGRLDHQLGDVRDVVAVTKRIGEFRPKVVFHLAAQSLVRRSHAEPAETFATNVLGTVHVLEAVRRYGGPCVVIVVTSDKCYEENADLSPRKEGDPLGGHDPYSASKACAEIVAATYTRSFFNGPRQLALATARAGNVIGGGDWAEDRIVPDCIRALSANRPIPVRRPDAVRPWQHVLEPLSGYLWLGARLWQSVTTGAPRVSSAFNFGPGPDSHRPVRALVEEMLRNWPGRWESVDVAGDVHENDCLRLSIDRAARELGWRPVWDFPTAVARTVSWYRGFLGEGRSLAPQLVETDLDAFAEGARKLGLPWTQ